MACEHSGGCGFFQKFHKRESPLWKAMIMQYCEHGTECARRVMFNAGQTPPSEDFMPVGVHASKAFLQMP